MALRGQPSQPLLGIGIYAPAEASRLIGVPVPRIRRWLGGYSYRDPLGKLRDMPPLWQSQIPANVFGLHLGFRDLIEVRVVDSLRKAGLGLSTIRKAIVAARDLTNDLHPFSTSQFQTDGRSVFLEIRSDAEEPELVDVLTRQRGFHRFIAPSFKNLEYDGAGAAVRWWPLTQKKRIVVDPTRSFGKPIDFDSGVPTSALADAVSAEGSETAAAAVFGVSVRSVRNALHFEQKLAA
ncbi:MAG: hypothetical protein ACOZAA_02880 [Pseudomonadota bacterium]